jgi:hypothetical protein
VPTDLAPIGLLAYNGWQFSQFARVLSFSQKPNPDATGRTIKSVQYELVVKDLITGDTTDDRVAAARSTLLKWGGRLLFRDRGMGNVDVNTGSRYDLEWGPKTEEVSFRYLGAAQACEIVWRCSWCVTDCDGAASAFRLMEFAYSLSWDRNALGYTTRTYTGHVQVPATRYGGPNDRRLLDSADNYLELITPPFLSGFRRIPGTAKISDDKMRLDFTIQDVEFETNIPPEGVVEAEADFNVTSSQVGLSQWVATLRAKYTIADGYDRGIAVDYFTQLIMEKINYQRDILGKPIQPLFLSWSMGEPEVYGPPTSTFSVSWSYAADLQEMMASSGLWRPLANNDWTKWAASMGDTLGPRARAGLVFDVGEDRIVDLCDPVPAIPSGKGRRYIPIKLKERILRSFCPTPEFSWYSYDCWIEVESDSGIVAIRKLPKTPPKPSPSPDASLAPGVVGQLDGFLGNVGQIPLAPVGNTLGSSNKLESTFQRRTGEMVYLYLCGSAMRICYPVPRPRLEKTDDYEPVEDNRLDKGEGFVCAAVAALPHTAYYAKWRLRYLVPKTFLSTLRLPANPFYAGE